MVEKNALKILIRELLLSVWSLSECSSCRILSMVCFLSWSSWSLVSLALAAVAPVSRPVCGPEAEWRSGLCWGGPTGCGVLDQHTSLERERLSAWRRLSGTALVYRKDLTRFDMGCQTSGRLSHQHYKLTLRLYYSLREWLVSNFYNFFYSSLAAVNLVAFILKV